MTEQDFGTGQHPDATSGPAISTTEKGAAQREQMILRAVPALETWAHANNDPIKRYADHSPEEQGEIRSIIGAILDSIGAPDMLAALLAVMDDTVSLDPHFCPDLEPETRKLIRAAIAKATDGTMTEQTPAETAPGGVNQLSGA